MLMKIFGTEREEVIEDETKLHIDEINDFYCSPNIIREIKKDVLGEAGDTHGRGEKCR
jgi:predicted DNA-binding protein